MPGQGICAIDAMDGALMTKDKKSARKTKEKKAARWWVAPAVILLILVLAIAGLFTYVILKFAEGDADLFGTGVSFDTVVLWAPIVLGAIGVLLILILILALVSAKKRARSKKEAAAESDEYPADAKWETTDMKVKCEKCGEIFRAEKSQYGHRAICPACWAKGKITAKPAPLAPTALCETKMREAPFHYGDYTLYRSDIALKNGKSRPIYFFSKHTPKSGEPTPKPDGYVVGVSEQTGMPFLMKEGHRIHHAAEEKSYRPQCMAITAADEQCTNSARRGSKYCASHKGYYPLTEGQMMKSMEDEPAQGIIHTKPAILGVQYENADTAASSEGDPKNYQCAAVTESGRQCGNVAKDGSKYCASHSGYHPRSFETWAHLRDTTPRVKNAPDTAPSVRKVATPRE